MAEEKQWRTSQEPIELRKRGDGPGVIEGYAAVFDSLSEDLGGFVEVIRKGAFDESLASKPDVAARIQHEGGLSTVGRTTNGTLKLKVDDRGLFYTVELPDTSAGRDIAELVRRGDINKSSFAFALRRTEDRESQRWDFEQEPPLRELLNLDLFDVAPVDGPAYQQTSVQARAAGQADLAAARMLFMRDAEKRSREMLNWAWGR